jgi:phosphinothricin acetyltransferase
LVEHAEASGRHVMVGAIEAGNTASVALHKWAGFEEAGVLRQVGRKFDRWLDLLFMQKILSGP